MWGGGEIGVSEVVSKDLIKEVEAILGLEGELRFLQVEGVGAG